MFLLKFQAFHRCGELPDGLLKILFAYVSQRSFLLIATKTPKVIVINKRVDHSQKTLKELRKSWNLLHSLKGDEDNGSPAGIQRFEFGRLWQEVVKQLLWCKIIWIIACGDLEWSVYWGRLWIKILLLSQGSMRRHEKFKTMSRIGAPGSWAS